MKKYRKYLLLFVLTVVAFYGSLRIPDVMLALSPTVNTLVVRRQDVAISVRCSGTIEDTAACPVQSELPLYIKEIAVQEGETVKEGQLLFSVDREATMQAVRLMSSLSDSPDSALAAGSSLTGSLLADQIPEAVYAPTDGRVKELTISPEKLYMPGKNAMSLSGEKGVQMRASFSESIIASVWPGQQATITGNGFEGTVYTGKIESLAESAKQIVHTTGTETVIEGVISIDGDCTGLRPGYNAQAEIVTDLRENALLVPYEAVGQDASNRKYVYQLDNGWARRRYIQTGVETADGMEILQGVEEGWELVQNPSVLNGDHIRVISRENREGDME
ncbi:MAG: HlyD family efflux transporter periplasmic adaptor subunit [Clostridiales bacterium]|nr:HlyD family efflux transporter periplasmic adaptor subunit [Clostridiales bacterium]